MGIESKPSHFYLEIDNSIFSTEEELVSHILNNYTKEVPTDVLTKMGAIEKELKFAFPNWNTHIKKISQGNSFAVTLSKDSLKFTLMYNKDSNEDLYGTFSTIPQLTTAFFSKQETVNRILESAKKVSCLKRFSFTSYYSGYSEEEEVFEFSFLNSNIDLSNIYFYPAEETVESFCALIEQFNTDVLEGKAVNTYNQYGLVEDIKVEGYSLKYLEMLGKKVRIEIRD